MLALWLCDEEEMWCLIAFTATSKFSPPTDTQLLSLWTTVALEFGKSGGNLTCQWCPWHTNFRVIFWLLLLRDISISLSDICVNSSRTYFRAASPSEVLYHWATMWSTIAVVLPSTVLSPTDTSPAPFFTMIARERGKLAGNFTVQDCPCRSKVMLTSWVSMFRLMATSPSAIFFNSSKTDFKWDSPSPEAYHWTMLAGWCVAEKILIILLTAFSTVSPPILSRSTPFKFKLALAVGKLNGKSILHSFPRCTKFMEMLRVSLLRLMLTTLSLAIAFSSLKTYLRAVPPTGPSYHWSVVTGVLACPTRALLSGSLSSKNKMTTNFTFSNAVKWKTDRWLEGGRGICLGV